ncbi:MAG: hypothetical protein QM608_10785 [Caulobacter sp.]
MQKSNSLERDGKRVLIAALLMAIVAITSFGWGTINQIHQRRGDLVKSGAGCASRSLPSDRERCENATLAARSVLASENSADAAIWQTTFNFFGLLGLAATIYLTRRTWWEAKRTADASDAGLAEARRDARTNLAISRATVAFYADDRPPRLRLSVDIKNLGQKACTKISYQLAGLVYIDPATERRLEYRIKYEDTIAVALGHGDAKIIELPISDPQPMGHEKPFKIFEGQAFALDIRNLWIKYTAEGEAPESSYFTLGMPFGKGDFFKADDRALRDLRIGPISNA